MRWVRNRFYDWPHKPKIIKKYFVNNNKPLEYWDVDKIKKYQEEALSELIKFVYSNNEHYRNKIDRAKISLDNFSIKDFEKIDFLTKEDIKNSKDLILSVPIEKIAQVHLSTGTTGGDVIYMMHTWEDLFINDLAPEMPILVPLKSNDVCAVALPYEMSSAGLSYHRVIQEGMKAAVIPVGKGGAYSDPQKTIKAIKDMNVNVLFTSPSYIMHLAEICKKHNLVIGKDINLRTIWLTGEGCSDSFRKRIEKIFKCSAYFYYGSLEAGPIGIECDEKNGYHITSGHVYVEIVDKNTNKVLEPGEIGEIVITTLLREGMPLIRYKTQDMGYIEDVPCGCGIKLKKLFLRGREQDQIIVSGNKYSPFYLEEKLMSIPEVGNNYRFFVKNDYLLIKTEIDKEVCKNKSLANIAQVIASKMEFHCGIPAKVEIVEKLEFVGTKVVRVVRQ